MNASLVALLALPAALAAQTPLPLKHAPQPTSAAINAADLMTRLYIFADDSMMGRETGTAGHVKSTAYIANELKRMGLTPAGDNGTFIQEVPATVRPLAIAKSSITVDGTTLKAGTDFVPQGAPRKPRSIEGATVIYGGTFGDTAGLPSADLLAGRIVVVSVRQGGGPGGGFGGGGGGGGFGGGQAYAQLLSGAAAIARIGGGTLPANLVRAASSPTANMAMQPSMPSTTPVMESPINLTVTESAAQTLLGMPVAQAKVGTVGKTVHGALVWDENPAPARNVVAILRGSDPKLRETYVAMGAHNDHVGYLATGNPPPDHDSLHLTNAARYAIVGMVSRGQQATQQQRDAVAAIKINLDSVRKLRPARADSIRNGADDDGSGTVALLEIAEAFARSTAKPRRSIVFVWHTGEEKGLWGSRWYADHPSVPRDSIVAQLNMDMVGRGEATDLPVGAQNYLQLVGTRRLSTELGDLVETVNKAQKQPFTFDYTFDANGHPENIYCRSDHFHYARWGIPVAFFTTGLHGDYHQVTDEPQYIAYDHMARVGQLVYDIAVRVANSPKRPVVDGVKMDPAGQCRQ